MQDYGSVDYLRLRVIPVLGTSPSIFGQALASHVLCQLAGKGYDADSGERMSKNLKHKVRQVLKKEEVRTVLTASYMHNNVMTNLTWRHLLCYTS